MSSFNRSINLTNYSLKRGIILTWIITIIIDIFAILANVIFAEVPIGVMTGSGKFALLSIFAINLLPFTIYFITNSMIIFSESLPVSITYGLTRKNFFISMIVNSLIISVLFSVIQGILFKLEPLIIDMLGKNARENFILFNTSSDNIFFVIAILFLMIISFISFVNLIVGLNYKFGFKLWLVLAALILLFALANRGLNISFGIIDQVENIVYGSDKSSGLIILGVITVLSNLINFVVIKFTDVRYEVQKSKY